MIALVHPARVALLSLVGTQADVPLVAKYDLAFGKIYRSVRCRQIAGSILKAPGSADDLDSFDVAAGIEPRYRCWKQRSVSILQQDRVTSVGYPMMVVVQDRGSVGSRSHAENLHAKRTFEVASRGAEGVAGVYEISQNLAANSAAVLL